MIFIVTAEIWTPNHVTQLSSTQLLALHAVHHLRGIYGCSLSLCLLTMNDSGFSGVIHRIRKVNKILQK